MGRPPPRPCIPPPPLETERLNETERAAKSARETKDRMEQSIRDLVGYIRLYVRCQLTLWRRLPWWALEAYDLTPDDAFDARLSDAFTRKIWWVYVPNGRLAVSFDTGQIMTERSALGDQKAAGDDEVLRLVASIDQLDAHAILLELKERAKGQADFWDTDAREKYKKEIRAIHNLTPPKDDE